MMKLNGNARKAYSLAEARRIADALNLRWGRFGVEQYTRAVNDGAGEDREEAPVAATAPVEDET
jgi:hypothetical protein